MSSKEIIITLIKSNCEINDKLMLALKPFGVSIQQFNVLRILRGQKGVAANLSTVQEHMTNKILFQFLTSGVWTLDLRIFELKSDSP